MSSFQDLLFCSLISCEHVTSVTVLLTNYITILICLYLYQYLLLWDISYIVGNGLMSTFQFKFNCVNPFSYSWDISRCVMGRLEHEQFLFSFSFIFWLYRDFVFFFFFFGRWRGTWHRSHMMCHMMSRHKA